MLVKLDSLNEDELNRQATSLKAINEFVLELKNSIEKNADQYLKDLSKSNEHLMIKFDDILTVDDVDKNGEFKFNNK